MRNRAKLTMVFGPRKDDLWRLAAAEGRNLFETILSTKAVKLLETFLNGGASARSNISVWFAPRAAGPVSFLVFWPEKAGGSLFVLEGAAPLFQRDAVSDRGGLQKTVLVVEDEADVADLVRYNLTKAGFRVIMARDGLSGFEAARRDHPDVVVLDLMLPEMHGEEVCCRLKSDESTARIPVIMLTAKAAERDRVAGLELGADDYVVKPFSPRELVLRVQAILRRTRPADSGAALTVGPLVLDRGSFQIRLGGKRLDLTSIEFKLLAMLMENQGRPLDRETLLRDVWGYRSMLDTRTVDTHVRRLRNKLGEFAGSIETVRGEGYRLRGGAEPR